MLFKTSAIVALGASAVVASPLQRFRRQETTTSAASEVTGSAAQSTAETSVAASATESSAISSAASSVESALSSVAASTGASTAPAPTTTSENGTDTPELAFGCPEGYSLTYAIGTSTYPSVELEQASTVLSNWTGAVPPPIMAVSSEGEGVGAMRTWMLESANITVMEMLTNQTELEDGGLQQTWNLTEPIDVSESLIVANATSDLTLYSNTTTNETSVQFYVNFCVNDQPAGLTLYAELVTAYLTGLNELFSMEGGNMTMSNSTAAGATSSVAEATSSVASSASSAAAEVTSAPASVASEATAGISSVLSQATGGGVGGVTSALGAATSAIAGVTGAIPTRA